MTPDPDPRGTCICDSRGSHPGSQAAPPPATDSRKRIQPQNPDPGSRPGATPRTEPEQNAIDTDWPPQQYDSAGLTQLDPDEITVSPAGCIPSEPQSDDDRALSHSFRHSGWSAQRQKTLHALTASGFADKRVKRFDTCGSTAFVLTTGGDQPIFRVASNRCHDRFCVPCALEKRRVIASNLQENLPQRQLRLITLTTKASSQPLARRLADLYAHFRKLRSQLYRARLLVGGIAFTEISRNERTSDWHPHLHVICEGKYIAKRQLRDMWLKITGDSFIVDIRLIRSPSEAAAYVLKYAAKALSSKVWNCHAALVEAIQALSGKRTFNCFGSWSGFALSRVPDTGLDWEFFSTLPDLIRRYKAGDTHAGAILRNLCNGESNVAPPSDLFDFP